jgi:hypothetical protein
LDALLIINLLNHSARNATLVDTAYYDTSGDGEASPLDALLVINALNVRISSPAEGEASVATTAANYRFRNRFVAP